MNLETEEIEYIGELVDCMVFDPITEKLCFCFKISGEHLLKISFGKGRSLIPADLYRLFYEGNY